MADLNNDIIDLYYSFDNENDDSNNSNDDDPEMTWEQRVQDYTEELEDLGWDWDAWDPCH